MLALSWVCCCVFCLRTMSITAFFKAYLKALITAKQGNENFVVASQLIMCPWENDPNGPGNRTQ